MLFIDRDRRDGRRVSLTRPCKVFEPRSRRYVGGSTCNVSAGGMMLRLDRALNVEPGDRLYVGVAQKRRQSLLRSGDMLEARVVRILALSSGEAGLAVSLEAGEETFLPVPRAA